MSASKQWIKFFAGKKRRQPPVEDALPHPEVPATTAANVEEGSGVSSDLPRRAQQQQQQQQQQQRRRRRHSPIRPLRERTYNKFRMDLESYTAVYGSDGPRLYLEQTINKAKAEMPSSTEEEAATEPADTLQSAWKQDQREHEVGKQHGLLGLPEKPPRGMKKHSVRAPAERGVDGWRSIWTRSKYQSSPCVNDGVDDIPVSKEDKFKIVGINGRKMTLKKNPFDAEYLAMQERLASKRAAASRRRLEEAGVKGGRQPSRLSTMSLMAEDVEYPTFVEQAARWSAADIGHCTMYEALVAHVETLTKQYDWKGEVREQTVEVLKRLQPRTDLIVSCESGAKVTYDGMSEEDKTRRSEAEKSVVQLRIKLKLVAKMYADAAMTASGDEMEEVEERAGEKQLQALKRSVNTLLTSVGTK
ncbi:hypothetical protein PV08_05561 [Exophiala spinifera]|uniref:Uncharacterized protein n=1 Tax=Exophiala spinifera TaxID=91928 RepID=A0A0D2BAE3_9EURO|nr:uncharacterized protein PV08_05561 [Exophiala spinifera]KIW15515.1 hypothetical protein PV08_05561 [Exophiala spinifera]